ncbi:MAG: RNA polymerase sigma factor, partial [bacterium]|nr:RNA polymerase sigma factor [bacterium]
MATPPHTLSDDDRLMARLAEDQPAALEELMQRWQTPLFRFIQRAVRDADVAEELTQDTFLRLWRARGQYRPGGRFASWLFRIASRLCLDHYRRQSRRPTLVGDDDFPPVSAPADDRPDRGVREAELIATLDAALGRLPLNQRLALEMVCFEEMSYREIAEALDCSVGAVEQLIFRARRALRERLGDYLAG